MTLKSVSVFFFLILLLCFSPVTAANKKAKRKKAAARSMDKDLRVRRSECEDSVDHALPAHERENLILVCISEKCYNDVYGEDPLEEGEVDTIRGKNYRHCCRTEDREAKLIEKNQQL